MEISLEKSDSLLRNNTNVDGKLEKSEEMPGEDSCAFVPDLALSKVFEEVDRFLETISASNDQSKLPQIPCPIYQLPKMVDSMVSKYESTETAVKFGRNEEEDSSFLQAVDRVSKMVEKLGDFPSNSAMKSCFNRMSGVLQRSMVFLEDEFRLLLDYSKRPGKNISDQKSLKSKQSSFNNEAVNNSPAADSESTEDEKFPAFSPEATSTMNRIATSMISAGYENECCLVYSLLRKNSFKDVLNKLGFDVNNIDDLQRMQWENLEDEIVTWIDVVKQSSTVLLSGEQKLCQSVFANFPSISQNVFSNLAQAVITRFLIFVEAMVLMKRSAEKLFKFLDIYEAMRDLTPILESVSDEYKNELISEASAATSRIGEAAVCIFCDLENSIRNDQGRTPVPSGAVHPLTRYTMNYLKYACEYKNTLEQVFRKHMKFSREQIRPEVDENDDQTPKTSPFAVQLMTVMDLLDANLDMKSKLYRDLSLRYIFLMNNGRYIVQKIKGSTEIRELMGNTWCRKRSTDLRQYHKSYQRETWYKLLQCLSHEGLQGNGKVYKQVLKERFKSFNTMFDEIHKTQSTWVVSDEQLQSELRVSISALVIPAYRSFLGRFKQHIESGKQTDKYIKYQPEDIETLVDELFDGNPNSMGRKR